ncbi:TPA: hypothetical protein ACGOVI_001683 [Streptococcus suis]
MERFNINPTKEKQELNTSILEEEIRKIFNTEDEAPEVDEVLTQIAKQVGKIPSLKRQYSDSQDFYDVSVWRLRELLRVSYELGKVHSQHQAKSPAFEKAQDIYEKTYLNLEIGDIVDFGSFTDFSYHYEDVFNGGNFQVWHGLVDNKMLEYTCQFKDFETARSLYDQLDNKDDNYFNILIVSLNKQEVEILGRNIVCMPRKC